MNRRRRRNAQSGFVMLTALVIMLAITIIGAITITSLLGEIQGEYGYNQAVSATSAAEAGLHWAVNKMTGTSVATQFYSGDQSQTVRDAGGQPIGAFDVVVNCDEAGTVVASAGCDSFAPNERWVRATGYVPSNATVLGQRILQMRVSQNTLFNKTICGYQNVTFDQGVQIQGDVGSEGTGIPDLSLNGPAGTAAQVVAGGSPGNVYAVSSVACSQGCASQVAGTVNNNQAPGTVCPPRTQVWNSYTCAPGNATFSGPSLTIDNTSASQYGSITIASGGTLIFQTAGPADVLTVQVDSVVLQSNTTVWIYGEGTVLLNVRSQLTVGQGSKFGWVPVNMALNPPRSSPQPGLARQMIVRSCNTGTPSPAIWFNQSGGLSGIFIAPYGTVKMDQAQASKGAILAGTVALDQSTNFGFDKTASAIGTGFNHLKSWQDIAP